MALFKGGAVEACHGICPKPLAPNFSPFCATPCTVVFVSSGSKLEVIAGGRAELARRHEGEKSPLPSPSFYPPVRGGGRHVEQILTRAVRDWYRSYYWLSRSEQTMVPLCRNLPRGAIEQALRSRVPAKRAEAFRELKSFPPDKAAKLLVQSGIGDPEPEVRRAACEVLRSDEEVCRVVFEVAREAGSGGERSRSRRPVDRRPAGLGFRGNPRPAWRSRGQMEGQIDAAVVVLIALADGFGVRADEQSLPSLGRLTRLKCFSDTFAFRRAVIQAMIRLHQPQAVGALISLLPKIDGEIRGDIIQYLTVATGQSLGPATEPWQAWWTQHKGDIELPAELAGPQRPDVSSRAGGSSASQGTVARTPSSYASYYGMSIHAKRIVFALDISGSMNGPRINTAKRELTTAINALPEDAGFGIVIFNEVLNVWRPCMVEATAANKQNAAWFIANLIPSGNTATYDALEAAFRFDAEAIYLVTDGEPTDGRIVAPPAIVAAVQQINHNRRVSIYVIGIAPRPPGGRFDMFLKTLAEQNLGQYRRVDQ